MRQLKIYKQPAHSAWEAENAYGLPFLQQLAAARPLGLEPSEETHYLRFIISVAKQYRDRGAAWESLLATEYAPLVSCAKGFQKEPNFALVYASFRLHAVFTNLLLYSAFGEDDEIIFSE